MENAINSKKQELSQISAKINEIDVKKAIEAIKLIKETKFGDKFQEMLDLQAIQDFSSRRENLISVLEAEISNCFAISEKSKLKWEEEIKKKIIESIGKEAKFKEFIELDSHLRIMMEKQDFTTLKLFLRESLNLIRSEGNNKYHKRRRRPFKKGGR